MRILVWLEQIYDTRLPLKIAGQQVVPQEGQPVYALSPASSTALAWSLRLRQSGSQVTSLALGESEVEAVLRSSLALGVDRAVHLESAGVSALEPWAAVEHVRQQVLSRRIDLVLCGESAFGPYLAEALDWPQITRATHLEVSGDGEIRARRLLERGDREELASRLPALIAFTSTGCEGKYVSRLRLQQAASLPIDRVHCQELSTPFLPGLTQIEVSQPKPRPRRMAAPASGMSASQRMSFLMGGAQGRSAAKENRLVEGDSGQAAEKILQFLKERGFL
jgi:electron transfer flavoprotein beta subunit